MGLLPLGAGRAELVRAGPGAVRPDAVQEIARAWPRFAEAARRRAVQNFDIHPWLERHRALFEDAGAM